MTTTTYEEAKKAKEVLIAYLEDRRLDENWDWMYNEEEIVLLKALKENYF